MLMHNPQTGEVLDVMSEVDETILIWAKAIVPELASEISESLDHLRDQRRQAYDDGFYVMHETPSSGEAGY